MKSINLKFKLLVPFCFFICLWSCKNCDPIAITYTTSVPYEVDTLIQEELTYTIIQDGGQISRIPGAMLLGTNPKIEFTKVIQNTSQHDGSFSLTIDATINDTRVRAFGSTYLTQGQTSEIKASSEITPNSLLEIDDAEVTSTIITPPIVSVEKRISKIRYEEHERLCNPFEEDCNKSQ